MYAQPALARFEEQLLRHPLALAVPGLERRARALEVVGLGHAARAVRELDVVLGVDGRRLGDEDEVLRLPRRGELDRGERPEHVRGPQLLVRVHPMDLVQGIAASAGRETKCQT